MTNARVTVPEPPKQTIVARARGLLTTPGEGWSALLAVVVMMLVAAVAIDDSAWVGVIGGTKTSQTAFLPVCALLATIVGYFLARSRLSTLKSHVLGALIGAGYLLVAASGALSSSDSISIRLHTLANSMGTFLTDVMFRGIRSAETSAFLLLVGGLLWAAGQLGAFALFRRHRAGPAITLAAAALLVNMSITIKDQLPHLIVLVAASLLLIVRTSLFSQLEQWRSRRIADSGYASQLFVRSGLTFVAVAIGLSLVLAANASSAPLRPIWDGALDRLVEAGVQVNHFLGGVQGEARGPNLLFTPSQTIRDQWETSSEEVFTAITDDGRGYKWRGATYDFFDGRSWQHIVGNDVPVAAFQDLQAVTRDAGLSAGRHNVLTEITSKTLAGHVIVAPADPVRLDHAATVQTSADGSFLDVRINDEITEGSSYLVTSRVFDQVGAGALTAADLADAGRDYGPELLPYVNVQDNAIGPVTTQVANNIVNGLDPKQRDPYHIALAMQNFLFKDGGFVYQTDVRGMCTGDNIVDCFLRERHGYCEYFATAMTMMLRTQQIPARYVVGYLPGKKQDDGSRLIERSASHAWVEVYFPGYGWYPFDPTPGLSDEGQEPTNLPAGSPRPSRAPTATEQAPNFGGNPPTDRPDRPTTPAAGDKGFMSVPAPVAIGVFGGVLLVALLLVLMARRRRIPGSGQLTYDSVARIASRFGYAPLPSQTAYEYADRLAVVVPTVRDELQVVATAKVEAVYARREPSDDVKMRLLLAYRRVRLSLLRVFLRRPRVSRPHLRRP